MVRFKSVASYDLGVVDVGTFQSYAPYGPQIGGVLSEDSRNISTFDARGAYTIAKIKAQESGVSVAQFNNALSFLNTPNTDESNFYSAIQLVEKYAYWLWGDVASGGVFFFDPQDTWNPNIITIMACNGCYTKVVDGVRYYRYLISGGMEPNRKQNELASCFLGYRWDENMIGFVTLHDDGSGGTYPIPALQASQSGYAPVGVVASFDSINQTKK